MDDRLFSPDKKLWIPGEGVVDPRLKRAIKAVEEYDERLEFAQHQDTGDWVVFVKIERDLLYPIVGWQEIPEPEAITSRLYELDARRRGTKILDEINRRNAEARKQMEAAADDATGQAAEAFEWGYRKMDAHPSPRIFVPRTI